MIKHFKNDRYKKFSKKKKNAPTFFLDAKSLIESTKLQKKVIKKIFFEVFRIEEVQLEVEKKFPLNFPEVEEMKSVYSVCSVIEDMPN